jgi:MerR family transcriptional regulator/heat shock protein HspR
MSKQLWTISEVLEILQINDSFLASLEKEEIVCPICHEDSSVKLFSAGELEKVRLAKILVEEMEVNLPGVEVILRMRQNMINMRRQFDAVLEDLAQRLKDAPQRRP